MGGSLLAVIIISLFIVGVLYWQPATEHLAATKPTAYIKLYEGYNYTNLAYNYVPGQIDYTTTDGIMRGYLREIVRCDLKSVDINLPKMGDPYDQIRHIEIWSMDDNPTSISSLVSGFYDSYLGSDDELGANPALARSLLQVLPGDHVQIEITRPVKKIFIKAIM